MMSLTKLMSPPNFNVCLPCVQVDRVGELPASLVRERRSLEELRDAKAQAVRDEGLRRTAIKRVRRLAGLRRAAELRLVIASPLETELIQQA